MNNNNNNNNWKLYIHTSPSGKNYVGITKQKCEKRWNNGNGYKYNTYFYNAIKKYGWHNFEHRIIKSNLTEENVKQEEIELIKKLQSNNSDYGYNITAGGDGTLGLSGKLHPFFNKKLSESHRKNMSISHRKMLNSNFDTNIYSVYGKNNHFSKSIYCFELEEFFDCISQATIRYKLNRDGISKCCNNKQLYCGKHHETNETLHWIFKNEYDNFKKEYNEVDILKLHIIKTKINCKKTLKKYSNETKIKMSKNHADFTGNKNPSSRKIFCIELNEFFDTMKEASIKYGISKSGICSCCIGKIKTSGKHPKTGEKLHWIYANACNKYGI